MRYGSVAVVLTVAAGSGIAAFALASAGRNSTAASTSETRSYTPPRTGWGDPDFQGVWRYEAVIALERPARFGGREFLTDSEIAQAEQLEKDQEAKRLAGLEGEAVGRQSVAASPIRGNEYNSFWQDHGRPRKVYKQTSLITDPRDGQIPYTPDARKADARAAARYGVGPYESFLDPDTGERCLTDGVTGMMWQGPNGGHNQIVQSPGYVTILHEEYRDRRIIPVDGRSHGNIRQWFGDSVGHWEGDTLVVDTTNFTNKTRFQGSSDQLHVVERITRMDAKTLLYRFTVEDPTTWDRPWTGEYPWVATDDKMYEYACHEGNYALVDTLRGARAKESEEAAGKIRK
jgi:hypothetical protein